MTVLTAFALAIGVAAVWLGTLALLRLSALGRLHAIGFVNVAAGGAFTVATWLSDGPSSRSGKALLIWLVLMLTGALSSHVTARAIHLRGADRR